MKITAAGKKLKADILSEFDILDRAGVEILDRAIESFCRLKEAERIIDREGLTVLNRFNEVREHPALNISRKARGQFLLAIKQLNLDVLPPNHRIGRPGGK